MGKWAGRHIETERMAFYVMNHVIKIYIFHLTTLFSSPSPAAPTPTDSQIKYWPQLYSYWPTFSIFQPALPHCILPILNIQQTSMANILYPLSALCYDVPFTHDMYVVNVTKGKFSILISILTFITSTLCLCTNTQNYNLIILKKLLTVYLQFYTSHHQI